MENLFDKWEFQKTLLTPEEQNKLVLKAQKEDKQAIENLVEYNMRLIISIAKKYVKKNIDIEDLIQEGVIWLIMWIRKYSPSFWVKFSYYISFRIEATIIKFLKRNNIIKIGSNNVKIVYAIIDAINENDWKVDIESLSKKLSLSEDKISNFLSYIGVMNPISLDKYWTEEEKDTLMNVLQDTSISVEQIILEQNRKKLIEEAIKKLPKRKQYIITERFWLRGNSCTLQHIWDKLWVSRERIRQIEKECLKQLRKILLSKDVRKEDIL